MSNLKNIWLSDRKIIANSCDLTFGAYFCTANKMQIFAKLVF